MHAEFLTQAPTPATPGVTCVVDTGVNSNPDNDASVIGRQTVYPGDGSDGDPDAHHGTYLAMNIAAPANGWGMVGIAPQTRILSIRAIDNGAHNFLSSAYQQGLDRCRTGQGQRGRERGHRAAGARPRRHRYHRRRPSGPEQDRLSSAPAGSRSWRRRATTGEGCSGPPATARRSRSAPATPTAAFATPRSRGSALDLSALGCGDDSALWDTGAPATIDGLEHQRRAWSPG